MKISIIVAADEQNGIGKNNELLCYLPADLKYFKNLTTGHSILMGRKTYESIGKPLPNRTHIVITKQTHYKVPEGVIVVNNLKNALDAAKGDKQPFIIGGGETASLINNDLKEKHQSFEHIYISTGGGALLEYLQNKLLYNKTLIGLDIFSH